MSDTQDKLDQATHAARDHGTEVARSAKEQAGSVRDEATTQAHALLRQSGDQVRSRAEEQTQEVATTLSGLAHELRSMAQGTDQPDGTMARLAEEGSQRLATIADRLETRGVDGALSDLRRYGRQRPLLFLGACAAAGFVLGRTLRNADTASLTESVRDGAQPSSDGEQSSHGEASSNEDAAAAGTTPPAATPDAGAEAPVITPAGSVPAGGGSGA